MVSVTFAHFTAQSALLLRFRRGFFVVAYLDCNLWLTHIPPPDLLPGSSYSWSQKRFAMLARWTLAFPLYLYVSLTQQSPTIP
jgi:hypothetical protein